jgi:hypothetical protein
MKSLYDKNSRHTDDALKLDSETQRAISGIFRKYADMGYDPRHIGHVMHGAINMEELDYVLRRQDEILEEEKEKVK